MLTPFHYSLRPDVIVSIDYNTFVSCICFAFSREVLTFTNEKAAKMLVFFFVEVCFRISEGGWDILHVCTCLFVFVLSLGSTAGVPTILFSTILGFYSWCTYYIVKYYPWVLQLVYLFCCFSTIPGFYSWCTCYIV